MRTYIAIFRMRFIAAMQYRVVVFSNLLMNLAWSAMFILAYAAFYRSDPSAFPMTFQQTVSYVWIQQTFMILFALVYADGDIETSLETGSIAYELARPADLYWRWFARACAVRAAFTVMRIPVLAAAFFLPGIFRLSAPPDLLQLALFIPSAILALGVTVALTMLMYVTMFHTISYRGVRVIFSGVTAFLSGGVIPLPFFPAAIRNVVELLPFASMLNMPSRIYNGDIAGWNAASGVALQAFWLVVLVLLGRVTMGLSLKKVVVQGG